MLALWSGRNRIDGITAAKAIASKSSGRRCYNNTHVQCTVFSVYMYKLTGSHLGKIQELTQVEMDETTWILCKKHYKHFRKPLFTINLR